MNVKFKDIAAMRKEKGMSRQDLVYRLRDIGIVTSYGTIQKWESMVSVPESVQLCVGIAAVLGSDIVVAE